MIEDRQFVVQLTAEALLRIPRAGQGSPLGFASSIERGLPADALDRLAELVAPGDANFKFRLISKATFERRKRSPTKRLTSEEGERLARLAKVFSFALAIYKDQAKVREFLNRPHVMLDHKTPLDVALTTGPGADAVINVLGRGAYGGGV